MHSFDLIGNARFHYRQCSPWPRYAFAVWLCRARLASMVHIKLFSLVLLKWVLFETVVNGIHVLVIDKLIMHALWGTILIEFMKSIVDNALDLQWIYASLNLKRKFFLSQNKAIVSFTNFCDPNRFYFLFSMPYK